MKIRFASIYGDMKRTTSFWYLITPQIKRYWNGEIIHIGTKSFYMEIDLRGVNSMQDFADIMTHPKTWYIMRKFKRK